VKPKPPVPLWRWTIWWMVLAAALVVFYGLLTPVWVGIRVAGRLAERRARRRRARRAAPAPAGDAAAP
jgi:hypothetical protein